MPTAPTATGFFSQCHKCGEYSDDPNEDGIQCLVCNLWFCDNCFDTGLGDGCRCHNLTEADMGSKTQHGG